MSTSIRKVKTSDLELKDRLVSIQRVTKVTKGGRTFSFSAIVIVGNEDKLFRIIDSRPGDCRLFTVGIGSAPNSFFMSRAATVCREAYISILERSVKFRIR